MSDDSKEHRHRVGLVGQSNLDVLHVARHLGVDEADFFGDALGELERFSDAAAEAGAAEARLGRGEELTDLALRRILPGRLRDEIDLAPVHPVEDAPIGMPSVRSRRSFSSVAT